MIATAPSGSWYASLARRTAYSTAESPGVTTGYELGERVQEGRVGDERSPSFSRWGWVSNVGWPIRGTRGEEHLGAERDSNRRVGEWLIVRDRRMRRHEGRSRGFIGNRKVWALGCCGPRSQEDRRLGHARREIGAGESLSERQHRAS